MKIVEIKITTAILNEKWAKSILRDHSALARIPEITIWSKNDMIPEEKLHVKDKDGKCIAALCPVCRQSEKDRERLMLLFHKTFNKGDVK